MKITYSTIVFLLGSVLFILACNDATNNRKLKEEFIEVYDVIDANNEAGKGKLTFMESYILDANDVKIEHRVYDMDKNLSSTEKYLFEPGSDEAKGSEYRDKSGKLLSYYKFNFEAGQQLKSVAFDGMTNEILRIEEYGYDDKGNQTSKLVKNADGTLSKGYRFTYDDKGNKTSLSVFDAQNQLIFQEKFTIASKSNNGQWTEKWGFRNDKPKTFRKRYWKAINKQ